MYERFRPCGRIKVIFVEFLYKFFVPKPKKPHFSPLFGEVENLAKTWVRTVCTVPLLQVKTDEYLLKIRPLRE
jgi:hypothetical protein